MKKLKIFKSFLGDMYLIREEAKDDDVIKMLTFAIEQTAKEMNIPYWKIVDLIRREHKKKG